MGRRASEIVMWAVLGVTALVGCGGGGGGSGGSSPPPGGDIPPTYTVTGTVSGLTGGSLVLQVNGGADIVVTANGTVTLATGLANGATYSLTIRTQPTSPPQNCAAANASGTVAGANVSNVTIACAPLPALAVVSSIPAHQATGVDSPTELRVTFTAPLATTPAPRTTATLQAATSGRIVPISSGGVSGAQLTLNLAEPLALQTRYTLTFTTDLRGTAGEQPAAPLTLEFTTRDGQWQTPATIEALAGNVANLDLALNDRGDAMAVFTRELSGNTTPFAVRYTGAAGWDTLGRVELSSDITLSANRLRVAMDDTGNAFAAWIQEDAQLSESVMARRYSAANNAWDAALEVDNSVVDAGWVDLGVDGAGNACAAWRQGYAIYVSRYDAAALTGWQSPTQLAGPSVPISSPSVTAALGCRVAWADVEAVSGTRDVWVADALGLNQWSTPSSLSIRSPTSLIEIQSHGNARGDAAVLWQTSALDFWVSRQSSSSGAAWTSPRELRSTNANPGIIEYIASAMDASGNILVAWVEMGPFGRQIWSARYTAGSGWSTAEVLADMQTGIVVEPYVAVAIDGAGNGMVLGVRTEGSGSTVRVWAKRHVPGAGWDAGTFVSGSLASLRPKVKVDALGRAWALWEQTNATGNADAFAARFE